MEPILNILVGICYALMTIIVFGLFWKLFFNQPKQPKPYAIETCSGCKNKIAIPDREWIYCSNCGNLVVTKHRIDE